MSSSSKSQPAVVRVRAHYYLHVQDSNTSVTRLVLGPATFTRAAHEVIVEGPTPCVAIPPRHFTIVTNPAMRPADAPLGEPLLDAAGQVRLRYGHEEVRLGATTLGEQERGGAAVWSQPFALYPGESLHKNGVTPLQVVAADSALLLRATHDVEQHVAGSEWLFVGPASYVPRVEVMVVEVVKSIVVHENAALQLRARRAFTDRTGTARRAGEAWLWRQTGAFLPACEEEVLGVAKATVLTDRRALHLAATEDYTDAYGKQRRAGDEWLVTAADAAVHIADVHEKVVNEVPVTTLAQNQYAVVVNPIGANGRPRPGQRELRRGERSFFLRPGEALENGIQSLIVLGEEEALLLSATCDFVDTTAAAAAAASAGGGDDGAGKKGGGSKKASSTTTTTAAAAAAAAGIKRAAGSRWQVYGPMEYCPPIEVNIIAKRRKIPLDRNEGVYVRNLKTGSVSAIIGRSYMLAPDEELYSKPLPAHVERLLQQTGRDETPHSKAGKSSASASATTSSGGGKRDPTRVVTYRAPHNSVCQVFDYKSQVSRCVFGPDLVILAPNEEFTVLTLSGGTPKKKGVIHSLALLLGPDFMTDVTIVETSDHARLSLRLSYNWHFEVGDPEDDAASQQLFSIGDFVGDVCKAIAAQVRAAVAATPFQQFHAESAKIIRKAVFGVDERGKVKDKLVFVSNRLVVTNIDVQSVEPVDQRTRDALQKSVQLAIEITTKSQEAGARHEAERLEQEARGKLERQRITDAAAAETSRKQLISLQARSLAVEAEGEAKASATAEADAALISADADIKAAELRARAIRIKEGAAIDQLNAKSAQELAYQKQLDELEVQRAEELAAIETEKFTSTVKALSSDVLVEIAQAGPKAQAEMLSGLGLKSLLITDGASPISLLDASKGLVAQQQ